MLKIRIEEDFYHLQGNMSLSQPQRKNSGNSPVVVFGPMAGPKYRVGRKIGRGSYGTLHLGKNLTTGEFVAIKLEKRNSPDPQLPTEWTIYQMLCCTQGDGVVGFPRAFYHGALEIGRQPYNGLIMELLCIDLEMMFESVCGREFSLKTVCMIVLQMLSRIEYVHSKNLLYVDVKPENFLVGLEGTPKEHIVHLVDFGLAKSYVDVRTKRHIPYREGVSPSGTMRYMSVNAHLCCEQSRRDDMEALGYLFIYFMKGKLPWSGIKVRTEEERFSKVGQIKKKTPPELLCKGMPEEFPNYLKAVKKLRFDETPPYKALKKPFEDLMSRKGLSNDNVFDWSGRLAEFRPQDDQTNGNENNCKSGFWSPDGTRLKGDMSVLPLERNLPKMR